MMMTIMMIALLVLEVYLSPTESTWFHDVPYNILILQAVHGMSGTWAFDSGGLHSTDYIYKAETGLKQ